MINKTVLSFVFFVIIFAYSSIGFADDNSTFSLQKENHRTFGKDIAEIVWSPDGTKIAARGWINTYLWDLKNDEQVWRVFSPNVIGSYGLAFSPDGNYVIFPSKETGQQAKPETYANQTTLTLVSVSNSNDMKYFRDGMLKDRLPVTRAFALANDGSVLGANLAYSGWITLYNTISGEVSGHVGQFLSKPLGRPYNPLHIAIDGKHKILVGSNADGEVETWDYEKNIKLADFSASATSVKSIAISPLSGEIITGGDGTVMGAPWKDGKLLVSQGSHDDADSLVCAWDAKTGKLIRKYPGLQEYNRVSSISVSPDGHYIAATQGGGNYDVTLFIWDSFSTKLLKKTNLGSGDNSPPVSFSPDSHRLAVGVDDGVIVYNLN